eukprot:CAMPEP_0203663704 /NCGR_PEP_ID=MMETSP0090-20130426/1238_1 /ASSEMBLY_ACC=CAM_ASM_001088 /TAXON_ID=426623 /ORGANISM="Chaetoceros affinis, Strain CCMP159" /LENGTH=580 /DNA_ID=CAMNT_0050526697 /DNA_START=71 /DNA_END=1813 /DNA_ORIENTATION=+
MGGNAAKERRKLKRLAEQQQREQQQQQKSPAESNNSNSKENAIDKSDNGKSTNNNNNKHQKLSHRKRERDDAPNLVRDHKLNKRRKGGKGNDHFDRQQKNKKKDATDTKVKIKKPKHLKRKMLQSMNSNDPKLLQKLKDQEKALMERKNQRNLKFKLKVIKLVGGQKYFNATAYDSVMKNGGGKLESIVEAVRIGRKDKQKDKKGEGKEEKDEVVVDEAVDEMMDEDGEKGGIATTTSAPVPETVKGEKSNGKLKEEKVEEPPTIEQEQGEMAENGGQEEPHQSGQDETETISNSNNNHNDGSSSSSSSSSSDSESDSDDDDDASPSTSTGRTRGRGRKGRKDADAKREKMNEASANQDEKKDKDKIQENKASAAEGKKRRCIGRKPCTDFKVGKVYTGTVVYVKPKLGIFIDIGCHSDAFCHISRIADDFVDTITEYKVGDVLENKVRLVDINRRKKKITASLQSDDKIDQEEQSNENWKKRQMERNAKMEKKRQYSGSHPSSFGDDMQQRNTSTGAYYDNQEETKSVNNQDEQEQQQDEELPIIVDPENMTPMELKRARKLQRRAERRKQKELTGIAA